MSSQYCFFPKIQFPSSSWWILADLLLFDEGRAVMGIWEGLFRLYSCLIMKGERSEVANGDDRGERAGGKENAAQDDVHSDII